MLGIVEGIDNFSLSFEEGQIVWWWTYKVASQSGKIFGFLGEST